MRGQPAGPTTMGDVHQLLPPTVTSRRRERVLVVVADVDHEVERLGIADSPWARARTVPIVGASARERRRRLLELDRVDLVVDCRDPAGRGQREAFETDFFQVDRHGAWVALRAAVPGPENEPFVDLVERLRGKRERGDRTGRWGEHVRALDSVRVAPAAVVVGMGRRHLLRLRETDLPLLARREPRLGVETIVTRDAGTFEARSHSHDHGGRPDPRVPTVLRYPVHTVRRYEGRLRLPRATLVHHRRSILPDSFRWHLATDLTSPGLRRVDDCMSGLRPSAPARRLDGSYFLFLYNNNGHFGHLMTEALAKLWGWWPAKAADPSLKLLCRLHPTRAGESVASRLESVLFPALGIPAHDVEWVEGPVEVQSLVGCTPMWHNAPPFYFHPAIRETWDRLGHALVDDARPEGPSRIFVTRRVGGRPCANVAEVEQLFDAHGFAVVSPERLDVAEQAALFAGARVVAGLGGAAMFNLAYARSVETVILLNQWAYQARNEHLFALALGAELHSFWNRPDHDHPPGGFSYDAHQSPWSFDFATNAGPLEELVSRLA